MSEQVGEEILSRIRKLQALAERAGSEAEAANAASRVAELCQRWNLDIGAVKLSEEEKEATAKKQTTQGRLKAHSVWIANAVCELFDVGTYTESGNTSLGLNSTRYFYGLKASVEGATISFLYLMATVEELLKGWKGGNPRAWRIGCASRIQDRAKEEAGKGRKMLEGNAEAGAIMVLGSALIKAHAKKEGLRTANVRGASGDAYAAGREAGKRVDLHGARTGRMLGGGG